jgi:hypothetical protein
MVSQALALLRPTSGTQRFESAPPAGGLLVAPPTSSAASRIQPDAVPRILVVDDQERVRWLAVMSGTTHGLPTTGCEEEEKEAP